MTKNEWQRYHEFIDDEMLAITDLLTTFNGKITVVNPIRNKNRIANMPTGLIKGIGYKKDRKIGNYKFNK